MTDIIPAPEGMWVILALYPYTEVIEVRSGITREVGAGTPELCATPVLGFANSEDGEPCTFYPVAFNGSASFAEPLTPDQEMLFAVKAYVMANGSPFAPSGLGKNVFTLDTLPEEYHHLLAPSTISSQPPVGRIERVANQAHKKLIEGGPQREYQVRSKLAHRDRSVVRDALRYLEDQGRATYDGTRWNAAYKGSALRSPSAETTDELAGS